METSLMSESVVNAGDVEESVTEVLTHFVQGGGEQAAMSVQLIAEQQFFLDLCVSECMYCGVC
jgi:hypothetical protein